MARVRNTIPVMAHAKYRNKRTFNHLTEKSKDFSRQLRGVPQPRPPSLLRRLRVPGRRGEKGEVYASPIGVTRDLNDIVEGSQDRDFRTWRDSTGIHWHEAALADFRAGTVYLFSSDGTLLEIPEEKLAQDDLIHLQSQDVYKKPHHRVTSCLF
jgi:hypothetical protein